MSMNTCYVYEACSFPHPTTPLFLYIVEDLGGNIKKHMWLQETMGSSSSSCSYFYEPPISMATPVCHCFFSLTKHTTHSSTHHICIYAYCSHPFSSFLNIKKNYQTRLLTSDHLCFTISIKHQIRVTFTCKNNIYFFSPFH